MPDPTMTVSQKAAGLAAARRYVAAEMQGYVSGMKEDGLYHPKPTSEIRDLIMGRGRDTIELSEAAQQHGGLVDGEPAAVATDASRMAKAFRTFGGATAAAGGVVQGYNGAQELRHGDTLNGVSDTMGGAMNVAGGVVAAAGSTVAAPVLFGGAALVDGGRDMVKGVKSGDNEKVAVGAAKEVGGSLMVGAGVAASTGVGAPVAAILATAGGVTYLAASAYEHRDAIGHVAVNVSSAASSAMAWIRSEF